MQISPGFTLHLPPSKEQQNKKQVYINYVTSVNVLLSYHNLKKKKCEDVGDIEPGINYIIYRQQFRVVQCLKYSYF